MHICGFYELSHFDTSIGLENTALVELQNPSWETTSAFDENEQQLQKLQDNPHPPYSQVKAVFIL